MLNLPPNSVCDRDMVVLDVHHIRPPLASVLPAANVHGRRPNKRAFPNGRT